MADMNPKRIKLYLSWYLELTSFFMLATVNLSCPNLPTSLLSLLWKSTIFSELSNIWLWTWHVHSSKVTEIEKRYYYGGTEVRTCCINDQCRSILINIGSNLIYSSQCRSININDDQFQKFDRSLIGIDQHWSLIQHVLWSDILRNTCMFLNTLSLNPLVTRHSSGQWGISVFNILGDT